MRRLPAAPSTARAAATILVLASIVGCEDASAPAAPAPPSPPYSVRFADAQIRVGEGDTVMVRRLYDVRSLASPTTQRPTASSDSAVSEEDYTLSGDTVTIPSGNGIQGEASVSLEALPDTFVTEGEETLSISLTLREPRAPCRRRSTS